MEKRTLLLFMQRILHNESPERAKLALIQLQQILRAQGADDEAQRLVADTLKSLPEAIDIATRQEFISEEDVALAKKRALRREEYEFRMARTGRC